MKQSITPFAFKSGVEYYLRHLLSDPINTQLPDNLKSAGFSNPDFLEKLLKRGIISRKENLKNDGAAQFEIIYHVNDNPKEKVNLLYKELFPEKLNEDVFKNEKEMKQDILNDKQLGYAYKTRGGVKLDETDCAGCLGGGGDNPDAGTFIAPLTKKPIRKKILYITEKQAKSLKRRLLAEEGVETTAFGGGFSFGYDAQAMDTKSDNDFFKDSLDHKDMFKKSKKNESDK